MVSSSPAIIGGEELSANFRPDFDSGGTDTRLAFRYTAQAEMQNEISASPIQVASHRLTTRCRDAIAAVPSAVTPIATPPQPGTAVKAEAPSIVSRIYRRLSIARA